ncbi:hypothetical protein IVB14_09015 [Bradyrhizobium sp. 180]|uniref:hypothetical protein n=1 Tax=unclassified Bradyrhizobium TaxID=2631580 RepID=UPI001FFA198D|nr:MULTISPECIES: hypothetical protein [unclassified Bradyrhizobium]MCK1490551.1 hypothetical protein [Bradyrhizobium sp. 180]MCK1618544.1 hypothetical protein [Bradyrhizobium sp. 159]
MTICAKPVASLKRLFNCIDHFSLAYPAHYFFHTNCENTLTPTAVAPRDTDDPRIGEVRLRTGMSRAGAGSLGKWGIRQAEVNYQTLSVDEHCEATYQF